jgi:hypothetical protein
MRVPSPGAGIAFLALLIALCGTAVALPGKNTVERNDIKRNAVTGAKVKNESLTGKDVKGLTGRDIDESTLGQVPSAATASNATNAESAATATNAANAAAVNGVGAVKLAQPRVPDNTAPAPAVSLNGLTIDTGCSPGGAAVLTVSYSASAFQTMYELGGVETRAESVAGAHATVLSGTTPTQASLHLSVGTADGRAFAFTGHAADGGFGDSARCTFFGVLTGG